MNACVDVGIWSKELYCSQLNDDRVRTCSHYYAHTWQQSKGPTFGKPERLSISFKIPLSSPCSRLKTFSFKPSKPKPFVFSTCVADSIAFPLWERGEKKKKKQKKHSKFWRSRSNGDVQNQFYGNGCVGTCASPRYSFFHQCWEQPCTSTCTFKRRFVPFSSFDSVIILMRKKVVLIWFGTRVFGKCCFYMRDGVCVYVYVDSGFAGVAIDQGIAYVLMLLALALTYIIHWQTAEAQKTDFSSLNFCVFSVFHFCFGFLAFVETGNLMVPYSLQYLEFFQFLALIVGTCPSCFFLLETVHKTWITAPLGPHSPQSKRHHTHMDLDPPLIYMETSSGVKIILFSNSATLWWTLLIRQKNVFRNLIFPIFEFGRYSPLHHFNYLYVNFKKN